jgi:arylsulfatase A-like enzyme
MRTESLNMMRRARLPLIVCIACLVAASSPLHAEDSAKQSAVTQSAKGQHPNVLMIAIDDQNDWIGCLKGHPQVQTPAIDALARRGTLFSNAHCQSPLCNSSRSSLLTGLRPSTTGIYGLAPGIRDVAQTKNQVTLPQTFTQAGYHTYTCGKIYHDGSVRPVDQAREFNTWGPRPGMPKPEKRFVKLPGNAHPLMDWGPFPERDEDNADWKIATAAVEAIGAAPRETPFFIACGFRLPHVPCFASQKWFDLYPDETLQLPPLKKGDRDDLPKFADYLHWKLPEPRLSTLEEINEFRSLVRAYLATVSFVDSQVARVLKALDESGRRDDTIIVLWSDHGWHLGEKDITGKNTLWERSTRVPLIFAGPGITAEQDCKQPVELLDIFPTLLEECHFPTRDDLEGLSLVPQLKDALTTRARPAITTHNQGNHAIRTETWRYIRYADGSEELYDLAADPNEWTNVAADSKHSKLKEELAKWLPKVDVPPAPGSKHRVLTYDANTGEVTWEGEKIDKNAPLPLP